MAKKKLDTSEDEARPAAQDAPAVLSFDEAINAPEAIGARVEAAAKRRPAWAND